MFHLNRLKYLTHPLDCLKHPHQDFTFLYTTAPKCLQVKKKSLAKNFFYKTPFAENANQESGFIEYLYLQPGEDLEINLRVQEFNKLSTNKDKCNAEYGYSQSQVRFFLIIMFRVS